MGPPLVVFFAFDGDDFAFDFAVFFSEAAVAEDAFLAFTADFFSPASAFLAPWPRPPLFAALFGDFAVFADVDFLAVFVLASAPPWALAPVDEQKKN